MELLKSAKLITTALENRMGLLNDLQEVEQYLMNYPTPIPKFKWEFFKEGEISHCFVWDKNENHKHPTSRLYYDQYDSKENVFIISKVFTECDMKTRLKYIQYVPQFFQELAKHIDEMNGE